MEIRHLTVADAAAYRRIRLHSLQSAPSAFRSSHEDEAKRDLANFVERMQERLSPRNCLLGAFDGAALVGTVGIHASEPKKQAHKPFLTGMFVDQTHQRRGIARQLIEAAIRVARTFEGVIDVELTVEAGNQGAIALYEKVGFVPWGRQPRALKIDGKYHDEINMVLAL